MKPPLTKPAGVANFMKDKLTKFGPSKPIIRALCNPGMQDRHRKLIACVIYGESGKTDSEGLPIPSKEFDTSDATVEELIKYDILLAHKKDQIEEISDKASKEDGNRKTMVKMKDEWEPLEFTCNECAGKEFHG
jgi:dynein heavy chain